MGPFGLMVAIDMEKDIEMAEAQVDKLGNIKERNMSGQPAPFFAPSEYLDEVIDYETMTRDGFYTKEEIREALKHAMVESGTFFQVALRPPYNTIVPYSKPFTVRVNAERLITFPSTSVVACIDKSYPALNEIIRVLWENNFIAIATSANKSGKHDTLTNAQSVWGTFGKDYSQLMILDNPALKEAMKALKLEQTSYSLALFAAGWDYQEMDVLRFDRKGNVDPEWVVRLFNEKLPADKKFRMDEGHIRRVLVEKPFFDLKKGAGGGKSEFAIGPVIYDVLKPVLTSVDL